MLVIREAQKEALRRASQRDFERRLQRHLGEKLGEAGPGPGIDASGVIQSARALGIRRERDIARYGELMYRHTGGLKPGGLSKAAQNILLAHGVDAAEKLDRLAAWADARREEKGGDA